MIKETKTVRFSYWTTPSVQKAVKRKAKKDNVSVNMVIDEGVRLILFAEGYLQEVNLSLRKKIKK